MRPSTEDQDPKGHLRCDHSLLVVVAVKDLAPLSTASTNPDCRCLPSAPFSMHTCDQMLTYVDKRYNSPHPLRPLPRHILQQVSTEDS
jgi:hypothetical protein